MIQVNSKKIEAITKIAQEIASRQTAEELHQFAQQTGKMYEAGTLAAEIAVKLILRVMGIGVESRGISPVDYLVDQAAQEYRSTCAW